MVGGWALQQLWMFWVAPIIGAVLAATAYTVFQEQPEPAAAPKVAAAKAGRR
jgi:aquaporin Z